MKKLLLAVIALIMTIGVASAQENMYVWKTDGTYVTFTVSEVDSIGFYMPENIGGGATGSVTSGIGVFSVSDTRKVTFSKGNLQYQASTNTWRFAELQYDYIGAANDNISDTYSGWIDLFGWGTGNAPTKTSTSDIDYSSFIDWGRNPISNGGNEAGLWRTLSSAEWGYLFNDRKDNAKLYGMGTIAGISGMILLPDNWENVKPSGVSFLSYSEGNANDHFSDNTYTAKQWQKMEDAGAVFLPAAGDRNSTSVGNTSVFNIGSSGYYWSSTQYDSYSAYRLYFNTSNLYPQGTNERYFAFSVRLVQVLQN